MSGHISGVAARLQKDEPTAIYVHCFGHSLNLCLQTLAKHVLPIREALELAKELGIFIDLSPKRSHMFEALKQQLTPEAPSIRMLCPTRWTVRARALEAILKIYKALLECMDEIQASGRDGYALKAVGYLQSLENFSTFFGLHLAYLIFSATEQLSLNTAEQEYYYTGGCDEFRTSCSIFRKAKITECI